MATKYVVTKKWFDGCTRFLGMFPSNWVNEYPDAKVFAQKKVAEAWARVHGATAWADYGEDTQRQLFTAEGA